MERYVELLRGYAPGDAAEAYLEPWMTAYAEKWRLRTAARTLGLELEFAARGDKSKLQFQVKALDPQKPPPQAMRRKKWGVEAGPPAGPPIRVEKVVEPDPVSRKAREYHFDLASYMAALRGFEPGEVGEVELEGLSRRTMKFRLGVAAGRLGLKLDYFPDVGTKLRFLVRKPEHRAPRYTKRNILPFGRGNT